MELECNVLILMLVSLCSAQSPFYLPPPSLSQPERVAELGLTPRYDALVYQYIAGLAGNQQPAQVAIIPSHYEDFGVSGGPALPDDGPKEPITEKPGSAGADQQPSVLQPSHLLPSDFVLLANSPQSQFFGHFDGVKNKKVQQGINAYALPPIGGVLSNYILQRGLYDNKVKRQTFAYSHDGTDEDVVINAAAQRVEESSTASNDKNSTSSSTTEQKEEPQPSVAQSKPAAVALAGAGGVAQAAPVATAVVGKDGLAIAAPSATAIAGKGASSINLGGEEKARKAAVAAEGTKKV